MKLNLNLFLLFINIIIFKYFTMGCKCANSNEEEEEEIKAKEIAEDNFKETEPKSNQYSPDINDNKNINFMNNNNINNINNTNKENKNRELSNENIQQNNNREFINITENKNLKYSNYPERIVELINNIRQDPQSYADTIENSIQNIIENNNQNDNSKTKIIYKQKIKVALTRGEIAFHEAAEELRNMSPLPPLEFSSNMCIHLPENEEEMKDPTFLRNQVKEMREEGIFIEAFFKDLVKIPEVSALLMIVDDSSKNPGKKRTALLNRDYRYIGVNSKFIGKTFIAYLSFSQ